MYNNYNPYAYQPRYLQQPIYQQPNELFNTVQRSSVLNGKQVESMDVVKAMDIPLDGSISYFPFADGSQIVTKQLQNDGTSKLLTYKLVEVEPENNGLEELRKEFSELKEQIAALKQEHKGE